MRSLRRVLLVALFALASFTLAPAAVGTSGTLVLTANTTLNEDHYGSIIIAADNIILDGAGYTVHGSGDGVGVNISSRTGVTVKNISVTGFTQGIYVSGSTHATIRHSYAFENLNGYVVEGSSANAFADDRAEDNTEAGFILVSGSTGNTLTNNLARGNGQNGFTAFMSGGNTFTGNQSTANSNGFVIAEGANGNTYSSNLARKNFDQGFVVVSSSQNTFTGNLARGNVLGFNVQPGSELNTFSANRGFDNSAWDAIDQNAPSTNVWVSNNFETTLGI